MHSVCTKYRLYCFCPTPDKAIKFEIKDVIQPNGCIKKVIYPYVIRELLLVVEFASTNVPFPANPEFLLLLKMKNAKLLPFKSICIFLKKRYRGSNQ
jgi:hypothetical protein